MRRHLAAAVAVAAVAATTFAQGLRFGGPEIKANTPYDGQFTFVRLRYGPPVPFASQRIPWTHDYPLGEQHFMQIMNEVTYLRPHITETNVMALDDPQLGLYPVAYMAEPGYWTITDDEADAFRAWLLKGGFVIFDDFAENRGGWDYFASQWNHVIPGGRWFELDGTHPIFHSFFEIPSPHEFLPPYDRGLRPAFMAAFENNDPDGRLMALANFNNDISEYWEFSNEGFAPISETNEAYKLGVNYVVYAMTH
ncbi:MAG: DUF4159 domain-containing protein [Vicinamibacterales bacterium]